MIISTPCSQCRENVINFRIKVLVLILQSIILWYYKPTLHYNSQEVLDEDNLFYYGRQSTEKWRINLAEIVKLIGIKKFFNYPFGRVMFIP